MATSGSFTGARGGSSTGPYLRLDWSRIQVDTPGNRSLLRLTLYLVSDYSINFSADKTGTLEGNSFTYTNNVSGAGTYTLKTLDIWYNHTSNGTLTTTLDAVFNIAITWSGNYVSSLSVSGSATIDTIARASDFTAFSLANSVLNTSTATTINYTLDEKDSSFSHDMTLKYGSKVIASWNTGSEGALTRTLSSTEVNSIITAMPTVTSGTLSLIMQTKSGSTNIGSAVTRTTSISLNSAIKPTATGLTASIYGTGRDKTINKYVQNISKVTSSFTGTAGYGATESSNTIVVRRQSDDANSQTISGESGTTANVVTLSGVYEIIATATDSRGRTATQTITITVDAYSSPSIATFTTTRSTTTTTNVSATINATWSPLGTSNPTDVVITGVNNAGASTTHYNLVDSTAGALNTTQTYTGQSDASSYTYTITITDSFGRKATATATVGTSFVEMTIAKGEGVGIGKVWEKGALDVGGDIHSSGRYLGAIGYTGDTGNRSSSSNTWVRIATATITGQYQDYSATISLMAHGSGSALGRRGTLYWRMKQQPALGNAPYIHLELFDRAAMYDENFICVLTTIDTTKTVAELWVEVLDTYSSIAYTVLQSNTPNINWESDNPLQATYSAGTAYRSWYSQGWFLADGQPSASSTAGGALRIEGYNNLLYMGTGNANNDRNAWIQSRHNDDNYATAYGTLHLNPLGGDVYVGGQYLHMANGASLENPSNGSLYVHYDASNYFKLNNGSTDCYFGGTNSLSLSGGTVQNGTGNIVLKSSVGYAVVQAAGSAEDVYLQANSEVRCVAPNTTATFRPILASAFSVNSEREKKTNIKKVTEGALEKVLATPVYDYHLTNELGEYELVDEVYTKVRDLDPEKVKKRKGLILEEAPEELVSGKNNEAIDLYAMNAMLWQAVQELTAEVQSLKGKIKNR